MDLGDLLTLQGTLFLLMLLGAYLTKKGVITKEGKRCLTGSCCLCDPSLYNL